jgi:glycerophosphoryl diester phosphodiesterase
MGPNAIARLKAGSLRVPAGRVVGDCAQVPVQHGRWTVVTRRFVQAAHRRGVQVHVWTIDDADEMDRLLDLGVDGIMTDRPSVLREVYRARNAWPAD